MIPQEQLSKIESQQFYQVSRCNVTEVKGISRVDYGITGKPPGTTEWS